MELAAGLHRRTWDGLVICLPCFAASASEQVVLCELIVCFVHAWVGSVLSGSVGGRRGAREGICHLSGVVS